MIPPPNLTVLARKVFLKSLPKPEEVGAVGASSGLYLYPTLLAG